MMVNILKKYTAKATILFVSTAFILVIMGIDRAQSQDFIKKPPDSWHQSFAPYEYPSETPGPKPRGVTIKVKETTTYEVVVDEKKVKSNNVTMEDLDLIEVKDKDKINFHQVDCYFYAKIKQTQKRSTDFITSMRWREGQQYWLSDGGKYVEWEPWSEWYQNSAKW